MTALRKTDYAEADDLTLLRGFAARDSAAVRRLTELYNQRLFRAAWSVLKSRSEAEDAVQSAYLRAFAAAGSFEGRSSLATWLTRIAINEALGRLRANKRRRAAFAGERVAVLDEYRDKLMRGSTSTQAPDAALALGQLRGLLERAIAALPESFRTVFVLREVEGMSVEDVAAALGIPPATVKTRDLRARRRLREALAPAVGNALNGAFPFAGVDCAALTERLVRVLCASG
jgi:RNA polymerase sigma-70 factor (ECF subfamily)